MELLNPHYQVGTLGISVKVSSVLWDRWLAYFHLLRWCHVLTSTTSWRYEDEVKLYNIIMLRISFTFVMG